ncbi:FkbM family methyltransferase, partial [Mesorhizobium sp. BR1-1-16]|uniref:FkbM family methyltransferase n=1 Tax=Mesorhizobium sp. BR1-1-16 TaxID=2876653 RepID=UPI001CCD5A60
CKRRAEGSISHDCAGRRMNRLSPEAITWNRRWIGSLGEELSSPVEIHDQLGGSMHILRTLRRQLRAVGGHDFFEKPDIQIPNQHYGSAYGGWCIIPEGIKPDSVVYSFGIGHDASFDIAIIEQLGVTVEAFDPTPSSVEWVEAQHFSPNFHMHAYGLADIDGLVTFNPPEDAHHVSHTMLDRPSTAAHAVTVPVKRLATITHELGHDHVDILKMDIEGAEYQVVTDLLASTIRPSQLLVEYHHRFPGVGIARSKASIAALRAAGYALFAVSATGEEYSFVFRGLKSLH